MKVPAQVWKFPSSSSSKTYETIQYRDGSLSCDCPGWTCRVLEDGSRTCKHVRNVMYGSKGPGTLLDHASVIPSVSNHSPQKQSPQLTAPKRKFNLE